MKMRIRITIAALFVGLIFGTASTSYYYWSSFNLENRNMVAQLVGTFDFLSPA